MDEAVMANVICRIYDIGKENRHESIMPLYATDQMIKLVVALIIFGGFVRMFQMSISLLVYFKKARF